MSQLFKWIKNIQHKQYSLIHEQMTHRLSDSQTHDSYN